MTRPDSPWYISVRAVSEYASLLGLDDEDDANFNRCEDELVGIARVAKFVKISTGGLLEYRGQLPTEARQLTRERTRETRLTLLVSAAKRAEGDLSQLVSLKLRGQR